MENVDVPIFEDPTLKAALRRHYRCDECCPAHVRDNIAMLFGEMKSPPTTSMRPGVHWWRSHGPSLAIAASMLVAIGVVTLTLSHSAHAVPTRLQTAACFRHDSCSSLHIKHVTPQVPQSFADVGQFLRTKLNHPVLAANFTKEQWHFRGAAICPVDGINAAHLLFDKGNQTLSVFSLPAASFPALKNKQTYEGSYEGHTVVARREDSAVYCLVCKDPSGSIDAGTLREMLQQHESEASVAAAPIKPSRNLHLALSIPTEN